MAHCLVNDTPAVLDFRPDTWGDLLDGLDRQLAAGGRVVTAVRFDGVELPSFRESAAAGTLLDAIARIDVEAEDAAALVRAAVDSAADSLPALVRGAGEAAAALRTGTPDAADQLVALVAAMQSLVALTAAAAYAARLSLATDAATEGRVNDACGAVASALEALIARHADGNAASLADAIDGQLAPAIGAWGDVLAPIRIGGRA
jgi:hypothetical protein